MSMSGNIFANYQQGSIPAIISGIWGNAGKPYEEASDEINKYLPQAQGYLNPFVQAGQGAIPDFQNWLKGMKDPSGFINTLMGGYQECTGRVRTH